MNRFLEETAEAFGLDSMLLMSLNLVMEEAVSNIIFYAYKEGETGENIRISMELEDGVLTIVLTDTGLPFDPTAREDPDVSLSAEERPIGGLGIFLIKKMMDEVVYRRKDDANVFIMSKKLKKKRYDWDGSTPERRRIGNCD